MALTERTRKFVMEITTNGTDPKVAAKSLGIPADSVTLMMKNPTVQREINAALSDQGLDNKYFVSKLRELCEANNGKYQPDWAARKSGLAMLMAVAGHEAPKQVNQTTTVMTYEERLLMIAEAENKEPILLEVESCQDLQTNGSE